MTRRVDASEFGEPIDSCPMAGWRMGRGSRLYLRGQELADGVGMRRSRKDEAKGLKTRDGKRHPLKDVGGARAELAWVITAGGIWVAATDYEPMQRDEITRGHEIRSNWWDIHRRKMGIATPMLLWPKKDKDGVPYVCAWPVDRDSTIWWFPGYFTKLPDKDMPSEWWDGDRLGGVWAVPPSAFSDLEEILD